MRGGRTGRIYDNEEVRIQMKEITLRALFRDTDAYAGQEVLIKGWSEITEIPISSALLN